MSTANDVATPKTLLCPHCGAQMNLTGRGRAPGSVVYLCSRCVPMLKVKELWKGQIVRTGNLGFGFVQLEGAQGLGGLRFAVEDCLQGSNGHRPTQHPAVGDWVLVLLSEDATQARKLWQLPRPSANGAAPRRRGVIAVLKAPDWGFITEFETGRTYFVHQSDMVGAGPLAVGCHVTFRLAETPKGPKASEVWVVTS